MFGQTEMVEQEVKKKYHLPHKMVYIPPGWFYMGAQTDNCDADYGEKPPHKVTISQGFWLGKYVVTQDLYLLVMGKSPSSFKGGDNPVENVSWCDAILFCNERIRTSTSKQRKCNRLVVSNSHQIMGKKSQAREKQTTIGRKLRVRTEEGREVEVKIACRILNRFLELGTATSERIA